jgi:hypothetical protein
VINPATGGWYLGEPNSTEISLFPVKVMCKFITPARPGHLGRNERHDFTCDVNVNEWNAIFYTAYGIWSLFLLVATVIDLIWIVLSMVPCCRHRRVKQLLRGGGYEKADPEQVKEFVDEGLGWSKCIQRIGARILTSSTLLSDGVLLLRFIETHTSGGGARKICRGLSDKYVEANRASNGRFATIVVL